MKTQVFINSKQQSQVTALDRGLQFGDGLFETIAVVDGKLCQLDKHLKRLNKGLDLLQIVFNRLDATLDLIHSCINAGDSGIAKIIITRGESQRGYHPSENSSSNVYVYLSPYEFTTSVDALLAEKLCLCKTPVSINPLTAGIKHLNRIDQVLASLECRQRDCDDGLVAIENNIIEATSSNLFIMKNQTLYTPEITSAGIAGIARECIIEVAESMSIQCITGTVTVDQCQSADAMFLTNSVTAIRPVSQFEQAHYLQENHPRELFTQALAHVYS